MGVFQTRMTRGRFTLGVVVYRDESRQRPKDTRYGRALDLYV